MSFHAYAAHSKKSALKPFVYEPAPLGPHDVEIRISHCGICHSDVHLVDGDWGMGSYPMVPGHEIVGTVAAVGPEVRHLEAGQRVGVGWQRGACLACESCVAGDENLCADNVATCVGHHGGFADRVRARRPLRVPHPRGARLRERRPAPVRRGHRLLAAAALGEAVDAGRRRRDRRPRATSPCSSRAPWAAR